MILFCKVTVIVQVEVSDTGTQLTYMPGVLLGGKVEHQCSLEVGNIILLT